MIFCALLPITPAAIAAAYSVLPFAAFTFDKRTDIAKRMVFAKRFQAAMSPLNSTSPTTPASFSLI